MKFAKELEEDLVPEWRAKYLNYKAGKKKIKAISRALRAVEHTPPTPGRRRFSNVLFSQHDIHTPFSDRPEVYRSASHCGPASSAARTLQSSVQQPDITADGSSQPLSLHPLPMPIPERQPLKSPGSRFAGQPGSYGSIVPSPPSEPAPLILPSLELPDPALDPDDASVASRGGILKKGTTLQKTTPHGYFDLLKHKNGRGRKDKPSIFPGPGNIFRPMGYSVKADGKTPFLRRMFTTGTGREVPVHHAPLEAVFELQSKEAEFFAFMDKELAKIESFYKLKEEEATERLRSLRQQLHIMRDTRFQESMKKKQKEDANGSADAITFVEGGSSVPRWKNAISGRSGQGKTSKAMQELATPSGPVPRSMRGVDEHRDFVRQQDLQEVPYRSAKRKLKLALLEFYRGLELLKAYADLNRKAFRKMNKKYDKVTHTRPTGRYVSEKVNKAWFVQSEVVENHLVAVEDIYARYFERGNRKTAVGKLRGKISRSEDYSPNSFRNGVTFAAGLVLALHGIVYAARRLHDDDPTIRVRTSYLLQIYGGYFLALFHFMLFCIDCRVWSTSKINYVFVFEFDTRHVLDWRQLAELPCLFFLLFGLILWVNFRFVTTIYIYWPILLIALTVAILFLPAPVLYHRSRKWFAYSNWRLLLAGLYPVEFRDFFLGDMYCSQTYAMGNVALFFCLYTNRWDSPPQCNSSHSRVMGFLTTLPSIWRALQCLRRYQDTKSYFPHIANLGKYTCSILYYMTISMYRIHKIPSLRALFITFALINAIYTSVWDVAMDWSLGNPYAKHRFLRDSLAFRKRWVYYAAMILDPILRFNWIFYAIFSDDVQHSAILSFLVSFSEVCRRGVWSVFRVENEHCTNVSRFRASRDVPLPYDIPSSRTSRSRASSADQQQQQQQQELQQQLEEIAQQVTSSPQQPPLTTVPSGGAISTSTDHHAAPTTPTPRYRRTSHGAAERGSPFPSRGLSRVGTMLAEAHAQDFERRKYVSVGVLGGDSPMQDPQRRGDSSTDEEEEDEDEELEEEIEAHAMREVLVSPRDDNGKGSVRG
ncbi:hypothetical protein AJ80_03840 [Polytolypa hystricis UAMH7299]|uniref:SPX domain-containing protein n=1 Tax=Polytolypa hystricis (strain UAMH7299) TaxID=1447883 RepID=A0A2B7YEI3_POLH7|nr:hypothetical protein AJ80_03840 [Polytolypa hystricis UAMH7299]